MAANNSPRQSSSVGEEGDLLWGTALVLLCVVFLYLMFHDAIATVVMWLRQLETWLCWSPERSQAVQNWLDFTNVKDVTLSMMYSSGQVLGYVLRWVTIPALGWMLFVLIKNHPEHRGVYNKTYSMKTLAEQESQRWPVIQPVLGRDLVNIPHTDPIDGLRMEPREYAYKHHIARRISPGETVMESDDIQIIDRQEVIDIAKARQVFAKQLGDVWPGYENLQHWEQGLFVAFAVQLRGNKGDNDSALQIINELCSSYNQAIKAKDIKKICSPLADQIAKSVIERKAVRRIIDAHAYKRTVFMTLLKKCRENGKLPPNWFRWVKTINRTTWYSLTDVGIDTSSIESAGVRAHWLAELMNEGPLLNPIIESAVRGLIEDLEEFAPPEEVESED